MTGRARNAAWAKTISRSNRPPLESTTGRRAAWPAPGARGVIRCGVLASRAHYAALPDELFDYRPPAGVPVFSTQDELEVREVSLEEAVRLASFTVLVPSRLPGAMTLQVVHYAPGGGFSGAKPSVMLLARDEQGYGGYVSIDESAAIDDEQDDGRDWQVTHHRRTTYVTYNDDCTSTWHYYVEGLPGAQDLGNWVLELPDCVGVVTASPEPW